MRIAINGMGRIGRLLFKRLVEVPGVEIVAVNDIMDPLNLEYLLRYDSIYGTWNKYIYLSEKGLEVEGKVTQLFTSPAISDLPWDVLQVDLVLEATGKFIDVNSCLDHIRAGAKRALLTTTGQPGVPLYIFGFGKDLPGDNEALFAAGGCMTNCCTQVLHLMEPLGIEAVHINIIHGYTSRQSLVDSPHTIWRRGRAAADSIIPVDTDLTRSLEALLQLEGRIHTASTRVPVANGAMADFVVQVAEPRFASQINQVFQKAAQGPKKEIVTYTNDPIVSVDIRNNASSVIIDGSLTSVKGSQVRVVGWFDNEYGYTSRIKDWVLWLRDKNAPSEHHH